MQVSERGTRMRRRRKDRIKNNDNNSPICLGNFFVKFSGIVIIFLLCS